MTKENTDLCALIAEEIVYPVILQIAGRVEDDDKYSNAANNNTTTRKWRDELLQMCRKTVSIVPNKHYDIVIRTFPALMKRFRGSKTMQWTVVSPWNVSRTFDSAQQLTRALVPSLETYAFDFFRTTTSADSKPIVRVQHGFVCLVSPERVLQLEQEGWSPCPECPEWLKGVKGLRWHCLQQHQQDFHVTLQQSSVENELALVVYQEGRTSLNRINVVDNTKDHNWNNNKAIEATLEGLLDDPWEYAKSGNLVQLQYYLAHHPQFHPNTARDRHGATMLMWAAGSGQLETVRYLMKDAQCCVRQVQHGRRSFAGRTTLMWAARNGHFGLVQYLLDQGADVYAETDDGTTVFHWTSWQGHVEILELLIGCAKDTEKLVQHCNSYGCNAALWAAQGAASVATFQFLQFVKCPLNVVNHAQHGVLHKAAQRGNPEICEWFVNAVLCRETEWRLIGPDEDGCLPSDIAGMQGSEELALYLMHQEEIYAQRLLEHGIECPDWFSRTSVPCRSRIWEPYAGIARLLALQLENRTTLPRPI